MPPKSSSVWQLIAVALGIVAIGVTVWIARSEFDRSTTTYGADFSGVVIAGEWLEGGVLSSDELRYLKVAGEEFFVTSVPGVNEKPAASEGNGVAWTGDFFTTQHVKIPYLGVTEGSPKLIDIPGHRWVELPPEVARLAATPEEFWGNGEAIRSWVEHSAVVWQPVPPLPED